MNQNRLFEGIGAPVRIRSVDEPIIDPALDLSIDPTLESDFRLDIEDIRKQRAFKATLHQHDPVAKAEQLRKQQQDTSKISGIYNLDYTDEDGREYELLAEVKREMQMTVEGESEAIIHLGYEMKDAGSDSDDEFDYLLDEDISNSSEIDMQAQRRAELEAKAEQYQILRQYGYGVHRQIHPSRVLASAGFGGSCEDGVVPRGAVVHLYDAYSPLSVSLDLCLEGMASRYPGTKFVRGLGKASLLSVNDDDTSHRWKNGHLPMLLALKEGAVVSFSSGLRDFNNAGQVESGAVEQWLGIAGVLSDTPPPMGAVCRVRSEEELRLDNVINLHGGLSCDGMASTDKDAEIVNDRYNCGVDGCNKSFFHQHVGVKNGVQDGLLVSATQVTSSTAQ